MARREPDGQLEEVWRQRIERWRGSGQSVRRFCAAEGIGEPAFYSWRRTLAERDGQVPPGGKVRRSNRLGKFIPVTVAPTMALVEIRCPSGHVVTLPSADRDTLRHLFAALVAEASC